MSHESLLRAHIKNLHHLLRILLVQLISKAQSTIDGGTSQNTSHNYQSGALVGAFLHKSSKVRFRLQKHVRYWEQ